MKNRLLDVKGIKKYYSIDRDIFLKKRLVKAVDGVSFYIDKSEVVGLVGESGCGKSTIARLVANLTAPTAGEVLFRGQNIFRLSGKVLKDMRRNIQIIFQNPVSSFDPRQNIDEILKEPLITHNLYTGAQLSKKIAELLEMVGLSEKDGRKYPHQFSGGQLQRIAIARAVSLGPSLLVCDEPLSSLDVSIQARMINMFLDIQQIQNISFLFISHSLNAVSALCDRIMVMYLGNIVEVAPNEELYQNPLHPYTNLLLKSAQLANFDNSELKLEEITTDVEGCKFYTRCSRREAACLKSCPMLQEINNGHYVACLIKNK